ncbi:hydrogenase maturation protease [Microbulbifer sp. SAOS-129_SWC]|uniref:hydrogenase maturation protease n=1 Tax=Microbulbifer sp. SAOS-129_SWC TaxID=3145235 RepID=UPI003217B67C
MPDSRLLIASLGHRFRSDDGVGPHILQLLWRRIGARADWYENTGDITGLLEVWQNRTVVLIDALHAPGRATGSVCRLDGLQNQPSLAAVSTHGIDLPQALELGALLNALPRSLAIYGICGENFSPGLSLSAAVQTAAQQIVAEIAARVISGCQADV